MELLCDKQDWARHLGKTPLRLLFYSSQKKSQKFFNDFLIKSPLGDFILSL